LDHPDDETEKNTNIAATHQVDLQLKRRMHGAWVS